VAKFVCISGGRNREKGKLPFMPVDDCKKGNAFAMAHDACFSIHGRLDRVKFLFGRPAALKASVSAIRKIRNPGPARYKREVQIHV
jgi:hypothetical protein